MRLLLHICCAICVAAPIRRLKENGLDVTGYFYNPNIHPLLEFRRRAKALKVLQESVKMEIIFEQDYGLKEYLEKVDTTNSSRCSDCYNLRLQSTAIYGKENNFDAFSSTLLFSQHQKHDLIKNLGFDIAENTGIDFEYFDYRDLAEESREIVSKRRIYKQSYCGCIFSEYERYKDTTKHLYKNEAVTSPGCDNSDSIVISN